MAQMDALFILLTVGSVIDSAEAANQIIIRRGYLKWKYTSQDVFNYTANICGNDGGVNDWCISKNAYQVTSVVAPVIDKWTKCACYCGFHFKTFLSREEKCVDISYLKQLDYFGNGAYQLDPPGNFTIANDSIQLKTMSSCEGCKVDSIKYFEKDDWKTLRPGHIKINRNCKLTWKSGSKKLASKILKIKFKDCKTPNGLFHFLKSSGTYVIDVPTPPLSTVAPNASSSMDSTDTPTFTSTSTSNVAPTPALTTSTHQASEFVSTSQLSPTKTFIVSSYVCSSGDICPSSSSALTTSTHQASKFVSTSQVSPTKTFIVSSYVCSSGDICPSSSSVAVLLPTTAMQSPTKLGRGSSSTSSPWPIIAAVVGCIVVGVLIAGLVVLRRRRRKNARARLSDNSAKAPPPDTDNPMYGHNRGDVISLSNRQSQIQENGEEEYDYATVDGGPSGHEKQATPIYQSLIKDNVRDSVYAPLNKEGTETPVEYSYNHLQHPQYNPPRPKSDPLYNTLEQPNDDEYMEPETQFTDNPTGASEPLYNVLEGPDGNPAPQDDDPVYNVLEDPDANQYPQDNDPVYNVLEGTETPVKYSYNHLQHPQYNPPRSKSDPLYNTLEKPNDDEYMEPETQITDNPTGASEPVYNVLEGPDDDYDNAPIDDDKDLAAPGQDNIAYSSTIDLKIPQTPSSPDYDVLEGPDGALPDSMYQPLGIRVHDDVYQPLDRTSQSIYQSLEPNDSTA